PSAKQTRHQGNWSNATLKCLYLHIDRRLSQVIRSIRFNADPGTHAYPRLADGRHSERRLSVTSDTAASP
ncbi:MAG: hypothetical protein MK106_13785, partial [Mariniblastus sp.]|nr:hypothetical protein [Mariniblastus sp.]